MAFIFIRHLPTDYNVQGLLQGKLDIPIAPLNDELQARITENCEQLKSYQPFEHILCSPLIRTQQTAAAHGYQATTEALLQELDFGPYEGKTRDAMLREIGNAWFDDPASVELGESMNTLLKRIQQFFTQYQNQGNVLAFTHGAWMRAARAWSEQGTLKTMNLSPIPNNALLVIEPPSSHV